MKKILSILVLGLLFISAPSQADDIRDFQIEGMSVGDSALDYFSAEEINNRKIAIYVAIIKLIPLLIANKWKRSALPMING